MTYGSNGSIIGPDNVPTSDSAPGVWSLGEIAEARRDGVWPEVYNAPVASGGTETTVGSYKYHTFTSSGTFTVTNAGSTGAVEILTVAGGGGSGYAQYGVASGTGGGGAGGYQDTTATVTATTYAVTIGAGGANTNGSDSSVATLVATASVGGGRSPWYSDYVVASNGGSGGGGTYGGGGNSYKAGGSGTTCLLYTSDAADDS